MLNGLGSGLNIRLGLTSTENTDLTVALIIYVNVSLLPVANKLKGFYLVCSCYATDNRVPLLQNCNYLQNSRLPIKH